MVLLPGNASSTHASAQWGTIAFDRNQPGQGEWIMEKETIEVPLYKGMPSVELTSDASVEPRQGEESLNTPSPQGPVSISLESLDLDFQFNQGYGLVSATTGCVSTPHGPNC